MGRKSAERKRTEGVRDAFWACRESEPNELVGSHRTEAREPVHDNVSPEKTTSSWRTATSKLKRALHITQ